LSIGVFLRLWAIVMFVLLGAGVSKSCQRSDVPSLGSIVRFHLFAS